MPLRFINEDITQISADVIVNPSDGSHFRDTNVSEAIFVIAGEKYAEILNCMDEIKTGSAVFTSAGDTDFKYVAHVALPYWDNGRKNELELLESCYEEVLYLADEKGCKSVAFPILGVGFYGIPTNAALVIAERTVRNYLNIKDSITVIISTTDRNAFQYISNIFPQYCVQDNKPDFNELTQLDYKLKHLGYRFIDSLSYYMSRSQLTPVQCYTAAGIDKKLFSKIKNNPNYFPSKNTIIKFVFALNLSLTETQQLLGTCGYFLSDSIVEDVIIKHFISQRIFEYDKLQEEITKRSL